MNHKPWMSRSVLCALGLLMMTPAAHARFEWGGIVREDRDNRIRGIAGVAFHFEGMVEETERKFYTRQGDPISAQGAESYDLSDFETDDLFGLAGLSYDVAWSWFRMQIDSVFMNPSFGGDARRDYYLTIGDSISYNGNSYDHLLIPEGDSFDADFVGNMTEWTLMLVPFGVQAGDWLEINPSLDLGVLLLGGQYDLNAGEPRGVTTYQYPPEEFVIGGHSRDWLGVGVPQWGVGVDMRMGRTNEVNFSVQAHYLFSNYDGSTAFFTTADHREKNLDFDHRNIRVRGELEIPTKSRTWLVGLQAQFIETEGALESTETDPVKIEAAPERFDKIFSFELSTLLATVGVAF